jgi:Icc-related predicted phosphoesterase
VRLAAAGDLHCAAADGGALAEAFAAVAERVDLVLLAGDLTAGGEPGEAAVVADACRGLAVPVLAVCGNHEADAGRRDEVIAVLRDAGVGVLDDEHAILGVGGTSVGVVGSVGFTGGFAGAHAFAMAGRGAARPAGERAARLEALDVGLRAVAGCGARIVLLHYAPTPATLVGEPRHLWPALGSEQLAVPILEHEPDLVVHAHAHLGTPDAELGGVPVVNVSLPLLDGGFRVLDLPLGG